MATDPSARSGRNGYVPWEESASQANARTGSPHTSTLRHGMRRIAIVLFFALLCTAPAVPARTGAGIGPDAIARVKLGMTKARATAVLAKPLRSDRLEDGYERLVSGATKVEVYFRAGARGVVAVTTWNRATRTDKGIGPCSPVAALRRAYGARLVPFRQGGKAV